MDIRTVKINAIHRELVFKGHTTLTYLKLDHAIKHNEFERLSKEERKDLKSILQEINKNILSTIKQL